MSQKSCLSNQCVFCLAFLLFFPGLTCIGYAQTGSVNEPIRYLGGVTIDPAVDEGRLRYAIGTESRQTVRANRTHSEWSDGSGWTYNHASNLCYWNGRFYQQYLSNPVDEHIEPGQTLVTTSPDGRNWEKPEVVFPPYEAPEGVEIPEGYRGYMMHQRMGFFVAPDGRLLVSGFYGNSEDPFREGGIGRFAICYNPIELDEYRYPLIVISSDDWNIYAPQWSPVEVADFPSEKNKSLLLLDKDPYDYARAIRVFEETKKAEINVKVFPKQSDSGILEIDVTDRYGNRLVRIKFDLVSRHLSNVG